MTQAPYLRTPQPSRTQGQWEQEFAETERILRRLLDLCTGAKDAEVELHDTAHSSLAGGSVSLGRSASPTSATHELGISDMTGSVATSPTHAYMRRQLAVAAAELPHLRRELRPLLRRMDKIAGILVQAIPMALDSDLRERLEQTQETARGYERRHRRPA